MKPVVEVKVGDATSLMTELEVELFRGFTPLERARYLKRIKEAVKRRAKVVTLDHKFLTWKEFRERPPLIDGVIPEVAEDWDLLSITSKKE